jgi:hypothetical protein
MKNAGYVCSNTSVTATMLRDTIKNTPCTIAADPYVILFDFLLTPRCRVVPEKITGAQLVKKFLAFYGT